MPKHVVVIASGETERRALPHLLAHLQGLDIEVEVRIPPGNRALGVEMVCKLVQSSLYGFPEGPPDKYVLLVDVDGKNPCTALAPFKENLPKRLGNQLSPKIQYAFAQWHLEAWYFADAKNLRGYFGGKALGHVDTSQPDEIRNPKLHLKNLLSDKFYTARISEEIAKMLDSQTIAQRSQSFHSLLEAVKNGILRTEADC